MAQSIAHAIASALTPLGPPTAQVFLLLLMVIGVVWTPFGAAICGRKARSKGLSVQRYRVAATIHSALFILPWAYLALRLSDRAVPRAFVVQGYVILFGLWLVGSVFAMALDPSRYHPVLTALNFAAWCMSLLLVWWLPRTLKRSDADHPYLPHFGVHRAVRSRCDLGAGVPRTAGCAERIALLTSGGTQMKYVLIGVLSIPPAALFAVDAALGVSSQHDSQLIEEAVFGFFMIVWGGIAFWAGRAPAVERAAARTCYAFALAAFLLPVAAIVSDITDPVPDAILPLVRICLVLGVVLGLLGLGAARFSKWLATQDR